MIMIKNEQVLCKMYASPTSCRVGIYSHPSDDVGGIPTFVLLEKLVKCLDPRFDRRL